MSRSYIKQYIAAAILLPGSVYGGVKLKDWALARELDSKTPSTASTPPRKIKDIPLKAEIVRLAKDRQLVLDEIAQTDERIIDLEKRLAKAASGQGS